MRKARVSSDKGNRAAPLWLSLRLPPPPLVSPITSLRGFRCCAAELGDRSGDSSGECNNEADTDGSDIACGSSGEGSDAEPVGGINGGGDAGVDIGFEV